MPVYINGETYYRTAEVCRAVGISKYTLFRWMKAGLIPDAHHRDSHGYRLFTPAELERIKDVHNTRAELRARIFRVFPNKEPGKD